MISIIFLTVLKLRIRAIYWLKLLNEVISHNGHYITLTRTNSVQTTSF